MKKGDYVQISPFSSEYANIAGSFGYIDYPIPYSHYSDTHKIGIRIEGKENKKSSYGLFWIKASNLTIITQQEYNYMLRKEGNNMFEKSYEEKVRGCDCDSSRSVRREARNTKVVDLYFNKKEQEIQNDYNKGRETLIAEDTNVIGLKAVADEIQAANPELVRPGIAYHYYVTKATEEAINKLSRKRSEELHSLGDKKNEVETLLSGCTSYDEELNILKGYGIVNISDTGITM